MAIRKVQQMWRSVFNLTVVETEPILKFRLQMFRLVVLACAGCIVLLNAYFIYAEKYFTVFALTIALFVYLACYYLAKLKSVRLGASLFLASSTAFTCLFMWKNEGLFDEAILAFPGFLIFAVLISNFTLARWLLLLIIVNLMAIGWVNEYQIYQHPHNASDLDSAIVLSIILIMVSTSAHVALVSMHKLLNSLSAENEKVKKSQSEVFRLQNHDALTGLPNRVLANQVFDERLKIARREKFELSLLFVDIDNFKTINDTFGHGIGDELLIAISIRLKNAVRETDTVCRFGGDEFIIVALHETNEYATEHSVLAEKLLAVLREPVDLELTQISPTVSIGISVAPTHASEFEDLYKKADLAMYAAKQAGRNGYQYYTNEMDNDSARYLTVAQALRTALTNNEFELHFQGSQRLDNNKIVSAEALLRWHHPSIQNLYPSEFIPIAERSGCIQEIGAWVLKEAVKSCKTWHEQGFDDLRVAVNISAIQFHKSDFVALIADVLNKYQLEGKYLILELTESLLFDIKNKFSQKVASLVDLGVKIAVDDFGTGYSNLGYLHKNDISILKIDKSFIFALHSSSQEKAIVESIIKMSHSLGMEIVAEGIETQDIKDTLSSMSCTYGQGYLWHKPMDAESFLSILKSATQAK